MMLLGGTNNSDAKFELLDAEVAELIRGGQYYEAYTYLTMVVNKSTAQQYNFALCQFFGGYFNECIQTLNDVRKSIKPSLNPSSLLSEQHQRIFNMQKELDTHYSPVTTTYVNSFSDLLNANIIRLQVDCLVRQERWQDVITLGRPMRHSNYNSINQAIILADEKLHYGEI